MRPTFKKKIGISRISFQVGNSANSATFPQSWKITGPKNLSIEMAFCPKEQFAKRCHFYLRSVSDHRRSVEDLREVCRGLSYIGLPTASCSRQLNPLRFLCYLFLVIMLCACMCACMWTCMMCDSSIALSRQQRYLLRCDVTNPTSA